MRTTEDIFKRLSAMKGRIVEVGDDGFACIMALGGSMRVIVSWGMGWEHVSASHPDRTPSWAEMAYLKDLFWEPEEAVMQLHPPQSQYVNHHPNCLHLWRPTQAEIPLPDPILVGPQSKAVRS